MGGKATIFSTPPLDICSPIHIASCPIYLTVNENFNQLVTVDATADKGLLQVGQPLALSISSTPSTPQASLDFVFTFGSKQYDYNYQLSSFPTSGTQQIANVQIPIGTLTAALGLPPLPISLNIVPQVTTDLTGQIQDSGFSGTPAQWSLTSAQSTTLTFAGGTDHATISLGPVTSLHEWVTSVQLGAPLVGSVTLYSAPQSATEFASNAQTAFDWYHVSVDSQYASTTGSGWYLSGSSATITVSSDAVSTGQGSRVVFAGWQGRGQGGYSGGQESATISVGGIVTEDVEWTTQYLVTVEAPLGGIISPSSSTQWYNNGYQLTTQESPSDGYQFKGWSVNGQLVSNSQSYSYTINSPTSISAQFTEVQVPVQASSNTNSGGNPASNSSRPFVDTNTLLLILGVGTLAVAAFAVTKIRRTTVGTHPSEKKTHPDAS